MAWLKSCRPAVLLCLLLGAAPLASALESYVQEIEVRNLSSASTPRFLGPLVLLTFQSPHRVRLVGARFAHEDYRIFHTYSRNENGIFLLLLEVPRDVETLRYRISVDGMWMNDPFNPGVEVDDFGTAFSVFSLASRPAPPLQSPRFEADGATTFVFRSQPGRRVYLVGDFNKWDPFWDRMPEVRPGLYRLTLRLTPGRHFYRFFVDGNRLLDPLNLENARDSDGNPVSMLVVPPVPKDNFSLYQTGDR
jgi:hypothetical protein